MFDGASGDLSKDYSKITSDLKKYASDLPVMAAISYGGRTVYGFQTCGKEIFNRLDKNQSNQRTKLFYTLVKGEGEGGNPTAASTAKLFDYITKNKFNPRLSNICLMSCFPSRKPRSHGSSSTGLKRSRKPQGNNRWHSKT